ncbi:MAG: YjdF family protein [Faecalibacterium sp.]|jgi:tRNA A37 threonylcarbamoyladenosine modification protein TsaB|nr:YjdF family protein [Faecalibacterium sp.]
MKNDHGRSSLTVLFEDPFWVGIYEREEYGRYEVSKITFGAEPKDCEVYAFLLEKGKSLRFSPPIKGTAPEEKHINPKRMRRIARRAAEQTAGIGTKAQQALQLQREQSKEEHQVLSRAQRAEQAARLYEQKQQKRREKHKGH